MKARNIAVIGFLAIAGIVLAVRLRTTEPKYAVPIYITVWDKYCVGNYAIHFIDIRRSFLGWEYLQSPENIWVSEYVINSWEAHAQSCAIA